MLGSALSRAFAKSDYEIFGSIRRSDEGLLDSPYNLVNLAIDENGDAITEIEFTNFDYVFNCIGLIPQKNVNHLPQIREMIAVNTIFPRNLTYALKDTKSKLIQIGTDCVFLGDRGNYLEFDTHDALDIYGVSKSLGEPHSDNTMILRSSIVGQDDKQNVSLYNWLLNHKLNSKISGYLNHQWNGVTTYAFAQICKAVVDYEMFQPGIQHLVPQNSVNKKTLLELIAKTNRRIDLQIEGVNTEYNVDRTLKTMNNEFNELLWSRAGYNGIPTIETLLEELVEN